MNPRTLPIISTYKSDFTSLSFILISPFRNGKLVTVIKNISNELMERSGTCTKEDVEW